MTKKVKYPRTKHLPWSPGASKDDMILSKNDVGHLSNFDVVVTEKMDGENTTIYSDCMHARSLDSVHHPSRAWIKALQGKVGYNIPTNWRVCGENLFAQHSIPYENLPSFFLVFNIWKNDNIALSWKETEVWCQKLNLLTVPILYKGIFDKNLIHETWLKKTNSKESEGYVVRPLIEIPYEKWSSQVGKYVRKNHVKTNKHWIKDWVPNSLIKE